MKQPFRYFRGEFNGKYLYSLVTCTNYAVQDVLDELVYQTLCQWKLEDEAGDGEMPIRDEDLIGIARIAGLSIPIIYGLTPGGSIYFTPSKIASGRERSERGLYDTETELHRFVRLENEDYPDDIASEATDKLRSSLVPHEAEPLGYLPHRTDLFTETGEVMWENLLPDPPDGGAPYNEFYGEQFLSFEELFKQSTFLTTAIFKRLLECIQSIRRNGPTIGSFMRVTRILGEGYIYDIDIVPQGRYYKVFYRTRDLTDVTYRTQHVAVWSRVCAWKFKLFNLEHVQEPEPEQED